MIRSIIKSAFLKKELMHNYSRAIVLSGTAEAMVLNDWIFTGSSLQQNHKYPVAQQAHHLQRDLIPHPASGKGTGGGNRNIHHL